MNKEVFTFTGITYERVSKKTAERAYNNGIDVVIAPVNMNVNSMWRPFSLINNQMLFDTTFQQVINEFHYYNCNNETGRYLKYYVEVKKDEISQDQKHSA